MSQQDTNKNAAIEFCRTACLGDPRNAVDRFVGGDYIQHNPVVGRQHNELAQCHAFSRSCERIRYTNPQIQSADTYSANERQVQPDWTVTRSMIETPET